MSIITQTNSTSEEFSHSISNFFHRFHLSDALKKSNAKHKKGHPVSVVFSFLLASIFTHGSTYRSYRKQKEELPFSDKTFRNLLNDPRIHWQKLQILIAKVVLAFLRPLTSQDRKTAFIIDDSMYTRLNAQKVECAALQYDHAQKKYLKGFRYLQLGWSDGNSFIPVAFSLLSGKRKIQSNNPLGDQRTNAGKRRAQAFRKGTEVTVELLREALKQGVQADYVLFDTWFSSPKMFQEIRTLQCHCVAMIKRSKKVHYRYQGQMMDVKQIFQANKKRRGRSRYLLSVQVEALVDNERLPIKLVYIRNRNKRNEYLVLASTDTALTEDEIIQLYSRRWNIEIYFKMCKQYLKLAKYQGLSYDGIFAHTTLVAVAYMILAVQERESKDDRTLGELFYLLLDELSEFSVAEAILQLLDLFQEAFANEYVLDETVLNNIIEQFLAKLPSSVQNQLEGTGTS
ncbi:IS4 family transposase [Tetragenococcus koreensis]|uniref:Transposase n=1 Tax=Tetragenococcus koreensis TaxID=290335 RepID=A0AAN4RIK8_9ENTE|nr:transposase [Tetragenococcus koreensis]GEQ48322.1 transposase [Tetragenococcus koreensis]GEQ50841.1 transposase [Tetragenococcus koreensis]GEQ53341.1 transposase [Tetragenococcus koreensis]GEQ55831.1 transposase [Tetragenococcus koreensis]GEQ58335.1 transposase [Tetragenococcus koreensis]